MSINAIGVIGIICSIGIMVSFVGHVVVTNRALKQKDEEIARLRAQLNKKDKVEVIYTVKDNRVPEFGGF